MVVTVTKTSFGRSTPRVISFRDFKSSKKIFLETFRKQIVLMSLVKYVKNSKSSCPNQTKVCVGQPSAIHGQTLSNAIMHRARFHNKDKNKTDESRRKYTKQRNYCVSLLRKSRKEYFKFVKNNDGTARVLNTFFSNIASDLMVIDCNNCDPLAENMQRPTLKAIVKHRNHPSIFIVGEVCKKNS